MLQQLFTTLGQLYNQVMLVIIAVILGIVTWGCWELYADTRLQNQFTTEGQLVAVTVMQADHQQRSWRDILGNSVYLTFTHQSKVYTTRFIRDTMYVSEGDTVRLLYHPGYNAFRQPGSIVHFDRPTQKSRLINWSTVFTFTDENRLLLLCLLLSTAAFFLISGVIVTFMPVPFLQDMARLILTLELLIGTIFFTYDTWAYFQYYQHLKTKGHEVSVQVLDTERIASRRSSETNWYDYEATIRYRRQERIIPISEDDFDTLKPGSSLLTFYEESVNDFMSTDYSPDYLRIIVPAFFGLLTVLMFRSIRSAKPKNQPTNL